IVPVTRESLSLPASRLFPAGPRSILAVVLEVVEEVVGAVGDAGLGADVIGVAAGRGGDATDGHQALDAGHLAEAPATIVRHRSEPQPRNRTGIGRVHARGHRGPDAAHVIGPGGAGEVNADLFVVGVAVSLEQDGLRRTEDPGESIARDLAVVDL